MWSARPRRCSSTRRATAAGGDELGQRRAGPIALLDLLAELRAEPVVVGGGEAVLRATGDPGRQELPHRLAVQPLAGPRPDPQRGGDALDKAHQLEVEERHPQLEAGGHRHLVVAEQDAVTQEHAGVEVESLLEQIAAIDVGQVAVCGGEALGASVRTREQAVARGVVGDLHQPQEALGVAPAAQHVCGAARLFSARHHPCQRRGGPGHGGGHEPEVIEHRGGLVAAVASVRLVGTLPGEHHLHPLGRKAR